MKKITITVGIPAYNEENNIKSLLEKLIIQNEINFIIKEIIVFSDGSSDKTIQYSKMISDERIKVIEGKTRKGKSQRLNQLFKISSGDILVQFDADIYINDKDTVYNLIEPMIKDKSIDLIYGTHKALPPRNFVEKITYFGFEVWDEARHDIRKKTDRYFSCGNSRAYSKKYRQKFRYPKFVGSGEDTYSFYYAKLHKYKIAYASKSVIYIRLPSSLKDYLKQMSRTLNHSKTMLNYFNKNFVEKYQTLGLRIMIKALLKKSLRTPPHIVLGFLILHIFPKIYAHFLKPKYLWDITISSKKVN